MVQLLERMGYGGEFENAGKSTQATRDGGIDGVIKEDILGLGKIYIQAKQYDRNQKIGIDPIRSFVGVLTGKSHKGVFITTSSYTDDAKKYANNLSSLNIVLIDGDQLAKYIYDHNLGMQTEQTLEIKKLDRDFWDPE